MSAYPQLVSAMPTSWLDHVNFKTPNKDDKLGYIDPKARGMTFRFVSASEDPLLVKGVRTPFDCFTPTDCNGKGRGKLTVRIQLNKKTWESLAGLDKVFSAYLVENRQKLFSTSDADYIGRDHSAIRLKMKGLAPYTAEGAPMHEGFVTARINGRCSEIDSLIVKDGSSGRYVAEIMWSPRTTALPASATRISVVTGITADNKPIMRETLPIEGPVAVGAQRVRYVGPGDISGKGCVVRYGLLRPAYWSIAPGGGASISLVLDSLVVQNLSEDMAQPAPLSSIPEGFAVYEEETALVPAVAPPSDKRRRVETAAVDERAGFQSPMGATARETLSQPGAPRRSFTAMSQPPPAPVKARRFKDEDEEDNEPLDEQKEVERAMERSLQEMHRSSAIRNTLYECSQTEEGEADE
jgi:hypothetical protein